MEEARSGEAATGTKEEARSGGAATGTKEEARSAGAATGTKEEARSGPRVSPEASPRAGSAATGMKEKGPLAGARRPKSREETPKEGSGKSIRLTYRNATIRDATHKSKCISATLLRNPVRESGN